MLTNTVRSFNEFDFIWASPPCQTHSSFRQNIGVRFRGVTPAYPDMKLYQEIIFLQNNATCNWVVENVKPYYTPLIQPTFEMQRHLFWSNKNIHSRTFECEKLRSAQIPDLETLHGVDLSLYPGPNKRQVLRNCVHKEVGLYIFEEMKKNIKQMDLFLMLHLLCYPHDQKETTSEQMLRIPTTFFLTLRISSG